LTGERVITCRTVHFLSGNLTEVAEMHHGEHSTAAALLVAARTRPISTPFSRFDIIPKCPGQTEKRTDVILLYQYRPLQKLLLVLNSRDCRVFEST